MSRMQTLRRIVLPQAMRVIVPPTGNETISMLKTTSLVAYVPYVELFFQTSAIGSRTFQPFPMLVTASLWYLAMTSVLMVGQYYIERYYARGSVRDLPPTPIQKLRMRLTGAEPAMSAAAATTPMVQAEQVHKSFGRLEVLKGIDLEVAPREVMCIVGPVRARASRRSCAASTTSSGSTPAGCRWTASWSATGSGATSSTRCTTRRSPASAWTSAWCSSGSTCSRT